MQFNLVVSTNERAIHVYTKLGFMIVGSLPSVFRHPDKGPVDAYVMHRFL
jgi:ribosomal protein S18 acetylase RimI-like enzyme